MADIGQSHRPDEDGVGIAASDENVVGESRPRAAPRFSAGVDHSSRKAISPADNLDPLENLDCLRDHLRPDAIAGRTAILCVAI